MLLTRNSGAKVVIPFGSCNYLTDYLTFPNKKASRIIRRGASRCQKKEPRSISFEGEGRGSC
jgi:hypothetical protein